MSISLSVLFSETPKSGGAPPATTALPLVSTMVNVVQNTNYIVLTHGN